MRNRHIVITFGLILLSSGFWISCRQGETGEVLTSSKEQKTPKDSPYIQGNQKILHWETEEIELFIKRYGWQMQRTGTGLYIQILKPGNGELFKEGDEVRLSYKTFLLDGQMIYSSEEEGDKIFKVARSEEIDGLHEAAQLLRPGARARLVIPSYMAYGVAGDGNKINGRLAIAMEVNVE